MTIVVLLVAKTDAKDFSKRECEEIKKQIKKGLVRIFSKFWITETRPIVKKTMKKYKRGAIPAPAELKTHSLQPVYCTS